MKIYTRTGDDGSTGLYGGGRVEKAHVRVDAYGLLDELNATLGWARAAPLPATIDATLARAQEGCFGLGAWLASAEGADPGVPSPGRADVDALEAAIDELEAHLAPLRHFVLPGGSEGAARLHVARTVARRAERCLVALDRAEATPAGAIAWTNRLSDYLFVAARATNAHDGVEECLWNPRG